jgi:hypothetical protein
MLPNGSRKLEMAGVKPEIRTHPLFNKIAKSVSHIRMAQFSIHYKGTGTEPGMMEPGKRAAVPTPSF